MRPEVVVLALATLGLGSITPAQAADIYGPPPAYGAAPAYRPAPPTAYVVPPPVYGPPPVVAYGPPAGVIAAPEGPAYIVSQPAYQPGSEYAQGPFLVDGRRYSRECWVEWGQPRCILRPNWFW